MLATLTAEFIEDLYTHSWGKVPTVRIQNINILQNLDGPIYLEISVAIDPKDTEALREAAKAYFKPYLQKHEKLTCWLNTYNKTIRLVGQACNPRKFRPELQNKSLELLLDKLSSTI